MPRRSNRIRAQQRSLPGAQENNDARSKRVRIVGEGTGNRSIEQQNVQELGTNDNTNMDVERANNSPERTNPTEVVPGTVENGNRIRMANFITPSNMTR